MNLPKSHTFLGNFCKGVKIYHFSKINIFGHLLLTFGDFFLVTLVVNQHFLPLYLADWLVHTKMALLKFYQNNYLLS